MKTIKIFIDASYCVSTGFATWGAYFKCPVTHERITISGILENIENSTHAEFQGVFEALERVCDMRSSRSEFLLLEHSHDVNKERFQVFCDCKSVSDLYHRKVRTKNLSIGRSLEKIKRTFSDKIEEIVFVPGHTDKRDTSEESVGNRRAHELAKLRLKDSRKAS